MSPDDGPTSSDVVVGVLVVLGFFAATALVACQVVAWFQ